jgi:hypothetical protein
VTGVLLQNGNIAVQYESDCIDIMDQSGTILRTIEKAATKSLTTSGIAEIERNVIVCVRGENLMFWCVETGNLLKEKQLGVRSILTFLA